MRPPFSDRVLARLIHTLPEGERGPLVSLLSLQRQEVLQTLGSFSTSPPPLPPLFDRIHWSWFSPILKTYSHHEQTLFLSIMPPFLRPKLEQELGLTVPLHLTPSHQGRSFLLKTLLQALLSSQPNLLPIDYLPESTLTSLLELTKKDLLWLIDGLSLYDLAKELQHVVDRTILKQIAKFLTPDKKHLFTQLSTRGDPLVHQPLYLNQWDGQSDSLRALLHRRGLQRLAIALASAYPDLVFYLSHRLDIGRGTTLLKLSAQPQESSLIDAMAQQIHTLLPMLPRSI